MTQQHDEDISVVFRKAVTGMKNNNVPLTPENFSVWYQYASESNESLSKAVDQLISRNTALTKDENKDLYHRYISEVKEAEITLMCSNFHSLLGNSKNEIEKASGDANNYETSLNVHANNIDIGNENSKGISHAQISNIVSSLVEENKQAVLASKNFHSRMTGLNEELRTLKEEYGAMSEQARHDHLSGLLNRTAFNVEINQVISECEKKGKDACLIMLDIDHFKKFNDTFGHLIGDEVIKFISNKLLKNVQGCDIVARYGGEEFVIILPDTKLQNAVIVAESLCSAVSANELKRAGSGASLGKVTISLGVSKHCNGDTAEDFVDRADQELYKAKNAGRNRVCYT